VNPLSEDNGDKEVNEENSEFSFSDDEEEMS
jgi:hypothetical protein